MAIEDLEKTCERCGYSWFSEISDLAECPKCKCKVGAETGEEKSANLIDEIEILKKDIDALKENLTGLNLGSYRN